MQKLTGVIVFLLLTSGWGFGQDEDASNRLFWEKDWVAWNKAQANKDTVFKIIVDDIEDFNPVELSGFPQLKGLIIKHVDLNDVSFLQNLPELEILELYRNDLRSLNGIGASPKITELVVNHNFIRDLSPLTPLTGLRILKLYENEIVDVGPLSTLRKLDHLDLGHNPIRSIDMLDSLKNLVAFSVYHCEMIRDLNVVSHFTSLTDLNVSLTKPSDFSLQSIAQLIKMKNLRVQGVVRSNEELVHLKGMKSLEQLTMGLNDKVTDISALGALPNLKYLDIHSNNITDISVLINLPGLVKLVMYKNKVTDISPLSFCPEIRSLFIFDNPVEDWEPLYKLTSLQHLDVSNSAFTPEERNRLRRALKGCAINFY